MFQKLLKTDYYSTMVIDGCCTLLTIHKPAPWLWKSKDKILCDIEQSENLIIDLRNLDELDISGLTLGDYLKNTCTKVTKKIGLIGKLAYLEGMSTFVSNVTTCECSSFNTLDEAVAWIEN